VHIHPRYRGTPPIFVMVADNRAGDRSVNTRAASSGSPAVRVSNTDVRFCARGELGKTFFSTGTGATHLSGRGVMGQRIECGKATRDRSPRAPHDLGHIPHAPIASLPRLHRRKAPAVFCGGGLIKIPDMLFDRRLPWLRQCHRHPWSPKT
jgi:hypothetical protein